MKIVARFAKSRIELSIRFTKELKMEKAVILYNSKTGTIKKYAEEIGNYLETKAIERQINFSFLGA
jgi:hypothetical protein